MKLRDLAKSKGVPHKRGAPIRHLVSGLEDHGTLNEEQATALHELLLLLKLEVGSQVQSEAAAVWTKQFGTDLLVGLEALQKRNANGGRHGLEYQEKPVS
jgi:hypothetical protein